MSCTKKSEKRIDTVRELSRKLTWVSDCPTLVITTVHASASNAAALAWVKVATVTIAPNTGRFSTQFK